MIREDVKTMVRDGYARLITETCVASDKATFACGLPELEIHEIGRRIGYTEGDLRSAPERANLGLGCGNPVAMAALLPGERVLDLGSGAGLDVFLAARAVGPGGHVVGLDITPEMVAFAREIALQGGYGNVEFRVGDMEEIPLEASCVDVVISNCSINLAPDKAKTFKEMCRVLKPGGRAAIVDIVLSEPLPEILLSSVEAYIGCLAGATLKDEYLNAMKAAGFSDVVVVKEAPFPLRFFAYEPVSRVARACLSPPETDKLNRSVLSISVVGEKS